MELDHARKRPIKSYSKGMQQRVGLAQALINNPDLLIPLLAEKFINALFPAAEPKIELPRE